MPLQHIIDDVIMNNPRIEHKSVFITRHALLMKKKKSVKQSVLFRILDYNQRGGGNRIFKQ